jgi:hypothetical protein
MRLRTVRSFFLLLAALSCMAAFGPSDRPSAGDDRSTPTARLGTEVRLRKLHLVRPDLIPYPLALEVYC